ncbi:MAG: glycerol-3-phosphate acyltransferase, partial [Planctomycetes bacterium]|nr:glycerol-3-phosphate acyltransferase [Planctomycetota bacterium]
VDLREHGSGNIGATNAGRLLGKLWGIGILLLDAAKGALPSLLAVRGWVPEGIAVGRPCALAAGLGAILGHCFPVWLSFRGGKGVSTGAGAFAAVAPKETACALGVFILVAAATRYVSLASMLAAASLVAWSAVFHAPLGADRDLGALALAAAMLVAWRHRANLNRLLGGTEPRLGAKREARSGKRDASGFGGDGA